MSQQPAPTGQLPDIDPRQLRNAFGKFATGVTVVTCRTPDGVPHGATVNAFTAVSLDPPLAQVTLIRGNKISGLLEDSPFAINIMSSGQLDTCLNFAGKPMKGEVAWRPDAEGIPVLEGNSATLECEPWAIYDGGDHLIVIGRVIALRSDDELEPLCFFSGKFREIGEHVGGAPWALCGDSMASGWFEGSTDFNAF
ncbi:MULTISPECIES: flavin reductase family protein [Paeniglutamicibacter]|uniref:Flavin reductase (DIM6/NTAB) family NADH-FMN oxidoreductase RutF n=1 Tax=Paeniglutamicibacter sulfureus TaxID=43666 RepID=A0ABU2BKS5_9MICC|nr:MULTISPECIES: flavin reductase family protein [Paeniglutamicibacter]MCV9994806.1 flavin reductase family protein [Paeniglutamicibacter sp. ZC-3]MDO2934944.1 flavin reductase family protein [Paeniglutamicibacter sulfureus]MDR7359244.1 flavin reductase (DIM6/NTAB) family NADH-FMN oxidoreductase RutF [Paeniglutamicibacter sulfureus]